VIPILAYEDIAAGHDYLVSVFGFEPGGVERDAAGTVDRVHGGMSVFVDDVDAHFARVTVRARDGTALQRCAK
jgi:hypothetical protein